MQKFFWPFLFSITLLCALFAFGTRAQERNEKIAPTADAHPQTSMNTEEKKFALAIHGGAGTIERSKLTAEHEREFRNGLERSLQTGYDILKKGGSSLDAAIMDGKTLKAGAVASLKHIKNPISLARLVMEKSPHVMMDCTGAEAFAKQMGVELVDEKYFYTEERWQALQKIKAAQKNGAAGGKKFIISDQERHGTVGAVAVDQAGDLAAATSTGGMTNKKAGRIGDSPVIGAGTYANDSTCAVSATGDGEFFIRSVVAHDISALMEYRGLSLQEAAQQVLAKVKKLGGEGGLIAIDRNGNIAQPFNTSGMYRGSVDSTGKFVVAIYR